MGNALCLEFRHGSNFKRDESCIDKRFYFRIKRNKFEKTCCKSLALTDESCSDKGFYLKSRRKARNSFYSNI
jgi:hypothetical protein